MRHRSLRALHAYWNALRGPRIAPTRGEIDPRAIGAQLGDVFLLEGAQDDFRFRLSGSRMVEAMRRELTGQPFHAIWSERTREEAERFVQIVSEEGEPILIGTRMVSMGGHPLPPLAPIPKFNPMREIHAQQNRPQENRPQERRRPMVGHGELLLLPLIHNGKVGARLLGAFVLMNPASVDDHFPQSLEITGSRILSQAAIPITPMGLIGADMADKVIATRGHLVLLRGDKTDLR